VYRALVEFGAPVAAHGVSSDLFAGEGYGYRFGVKPNLVELLTTVFAATITGGCCSGSCAHETPSTAAIAAYLNGAP
jgi:hypothetical protein